MQLINIINDVRKLCLKKGITVEPQILMDGFSASGKFVNCFVALHPQMIKAVASGGVNSMPVLPLDFMNGEYIHRT